MGLSCAFEYMQTSDIHVCEQELTLGTPRGCCQLNLFPTTSICQCLIPLPGVFSWSSLSMLFHYFINFCAGSFLCYFIDSFSVLLPSCCCSSYRSSFILLLILVALFWNFSERSLHLFDKERPELHAEQKEWEIMDIWSGMMMMSSFLFLSFFLSWQLLILAFPWTAY